MVNDYLFQSKNTACIETSAEFDTILILGRFSILNILNTISVFPFLFQFYVLCEWMPARVFNFSLQEAVYMLCLTRKINEAILIGDLIRITVTSITDKKVRLSVEAPQGVKIHREEVYKRMKNKNDK